MHVPRGFDLAVHRRARLRELGQFVPEIKRRRHHVLVLAKHPRELADRHLAVAVHVHLAHDIVETLGHAAHAAEIGESAALPIRAGPDDAIRIPAEIRRAHDALELLLRHASVVVRVEETPREVDVLVELAADARARLAELRETHDELEDAHLAVAAQVEERHQAGKVGVPALDVEGTRELLQVDRAVLVPVGAFVQRDDAANRAAAAPEALRGKGRGAEDGSAE